MNQPTDNEDVLVQNHPIYWFPDGSLILDVEVQRFKVHHTLLSRHSRFFSAVEAKKEGHLEGTTHQQSGASNDENRDGPKHVVLEPKSKIKAADVEALLQHLYHDAPLSKDSPASHVMSVLLVSSPQHLDFPVIHKRALELFEDFFPKNPESFTHNHPLYDALPIATELNLHEVRKAIIYSLVTTTEFDVDDILPTNEVENQAPQSSSELNGSMAESPLTPFPKKIQRLSPADARICMSLMTKVIDHFTPILFTPAATRHMECTDVFARLWMPLVIQPALEDDGVYKPLETLQRIKEIDWAGHGLCTSCVVEKREEWTDEQKTVWDLMDRWLSEAPLQQA
ncbi:hypothetical protein CPC08DRAFT_824620 [Agrocybe pediades]|nr:hypothetical protein CPC08DRAFT_824620 [Agrocybe pediades]